MAGGEQARGAEGKWGEVVKKLPSAARVPQTFQPTEAGLQRWTSKRDVKRHTYKSDFTAAVGSAGCAWSGGGTGRVGLGVGIWNGAVDGVAPQEVVRLRGQTQ